MIFLRNWKPERSKNPRRKAKTSKNPERRRRKEPESEIVELEKLGDSYIGKKKPFNHIDGA